MGTWILGAAMTLLSLVGLFVASGAVRGTLYYVGLGLFALGLVAAAGAGLAATCRRSPSRHRRDASGLSRPQPRAKCDTPRRWPLPA